MDGRANTAKRAPGERERAARLLFWLESEGYQLTVEGDFLRVCGSLSDRLRAAIREHKPMLIALMCARGNSRGVH